MNDMKVDCLLDYLGQFKIQIISHILPWYLSAFLSYICEKVSTNCVKI